jgi:2-amino-4-hydroxy-6-hydroxymethyldihydropteridine diphosphokinase
MPSARAYVGLGSNLGDRIATLRSAVAALRRLPHTQLQHASSVYETTAVGPAGAPFLNAVVELETQLDPRGLLDALLVIEREHGRVRDTRWGARTLDLDLLVYLDHDGSMVECVAPGLVLPHPRMLERDFVLAPLRDVAPSLSLAGTRVDAHLLALPADARTIQAQRPAAWYLAAPEGG